MLPAAHAKRGRSCRRQGFFHMENIVNSFNSLYKAYRKTRSGKRDNPTAMRYRMEAIERTADLSDRLQRREYTFGPYYPFKVYEPKERLVLAIDFEGKVVQHSLCDPGSPSATSRANCSPCSIWTTSTTGCGMTLASSMAVTWMTSTSSAATSCCSGRSSSGSRSTSSRWACA